MNFCKLAQFIKRFTTLRQNKEKKWLKTEKKD